MHTNFLHAKIDTEMQRVMFVKHSAAVITRGAAVASKNLQEADRSNELYMLSIYS